MSLLFLSDSNARLPLYDPEANNSFEVYIAERQELTSPVGFTTRLAGFASIIG
jgi:hypothetical protein